MVNPIQLYIFDNKIYLNQDGEVVVSLNSNYKLVCNVWIQTASSTVSYKLCNIKSIHRSGCINIKMLKIYNGNIKGVSFVIESGK